MTPLLLSGASRQHRRPRIPVVPGERFGWLRTVRLVGVHPNYGAVVEYACACGGTTTRNAAEVRSLARRGVTQACSRHCRHTMRVPARLRGEDSHV